MKNIPDLLPCPFCGAESDFTGDTGVMCSNKECGTIQPGYDISTGPSAIFVAANRWNRRATNINKNDERK